MHNVGTKTSSQRKGQAAGGMPIQWSQITTPQIPIQFSHQTVRMWCGIVVEIDICSWMSRDQAMLGIWPGRGGGPRGPGVPYQGARSGSPPSEDDDDDNDTCMTPEAVPACSPARRKKRKTCRKHSTLTQHGHGIRLKHDGVLSVSRFHDDTVWGFQLVVNSEILAHRHLDVFLSLLIWKPKRHR